MSTNPLTENKKYLFISFIYLKCQRKSQMKFNIVEPEQVAKNACN
jgi:hypothetical protein